MSGEAVPTLRAALKQAHALGMQVEWVNRTGEVRVRLAAGGRWVTCNSRKKDASRALLDMIREQKEQG